MEIVDDSGGIFHVFQMRIGMNEFDHRILALLKAALKCDDQKFVH